jgi:hypothetical protein
VSKWLLLVYKVPREPTAGRVYVWRKMKQLGAISMQDAVWVLPATQRTREQFQWLAAEIDELGGEATLWNSDLAYDSQAKSLVAQFTAQVDDEYGKIIKGLTRKRPDLKSLVAQYQAVAARDHFQSPLGRKARKKLLGARGGRSS